MVIEICKFEFVTMTMQTTCQDDEQDDSGDRRLHSSSDDCESAERGSQSHQYGAYDCTVSAAGTTPTKHDEWKSCANASSDAWEITEWSRPFNPYGASDRAGGTTGTTPFTLVEWKSDKNASNDAWDASQWDRLIRRYDSADVRPRTTPTTRDTLGMDAFRSAGRNQDTYLVDDASDYAKRANMTSTYDIGKHDNDNTWTYDSDKRDDGKTLGVGSPKRDDDNTWTYDNDKRDDGKTWEGGSSKRDDEETWKNTDGHTWRYGSDKWDDVNTRTNADHKYQSWSSDDICSAATKTSDSWYNNTRGEADAGQYSGNCWDYNAQGLHAECNPDKHSDNSDTKTAEKLDKTDDQDKGMTGNTEDTDNKTTLMTPADTEKLPENTGNDTVDVRQGGGDAAAELSTEVKAADTGADVSREEG